MPTITVKDASNVTQTVQTLPPVGAALIAASLPVTVASDQVVTVLAKAKYNATPFTLTDNNLANLQVDVNGNLKVNLAAGPAQYETVAASQTAQVIGATGATGDFISHLLVIPASTSPGAVTLLDGATSITVFAGGASSVSNLAPFSIPLGMKSVSGAWKITTGAAVSVIAVGTFI